MTSALHAEGREFDSHWRYIVFVPVAQRIRHLTTNQGIVGSNPTGDVFCNIFIYSVIPKNSFRIIFELKLGVLCKNKKVPAPGFEPGSHG